MPKVWNDKTGKVVAFDLKNTPELIRLYKAGSSLSELKRKWHCYGNPLRRILIEEGIYKVAGKTVKPPAVAKKAVKTAEVKKAKAAPAPAPKPEVHDPLKQVTLITEAA